MKSIVQYGGDGKEVTRNDFNYYGKRELVPMADGRAGGATTDGFTSIKNIKPGKMDQTWSEAFYTQESSIMLIPWLVTLNANTERNFAYTNVKYSYVPPVLKEVISKSSLDGTSNKVSYTAFDYLTGTTLQTESKDSYGNNRIARSYPAYWKYPKLGVPSTSAPDNLNVLTPVTANYTYLNTVGNSSILSASVQEYTKDSIHFDNSVHSLNKGYSGNNFSYNYELLPGDTLERLYNTNKKLRSTLPYAIGEGLANPLYVDDAKFLYKPYRSFVYEADLNNNGTYAGTFNNFNWATFAQSAGWKAITTNTLWDLMGNVIETKDILNKYAASFIGYNYNHSRGGITNSTKGQTVFGDGENLYTSPSGNVQFSDDGALKPVNAGQILAAAKTFSQRTLSFNNIASQTQVITVCVTTATNYNTNFGKADVQFLNTRGMWMKRTLYFSINENKDVKAFSNQGESFSGFYAIPDAAQSGCTSKWKVAFDKNVFTAFTYTALSNGYTSTFNPNETLAACNVPDLVYQLPETNGGNVHTGNAAYFLNPGGVGTQFSINVAKLPATEKIRAYKAMVWVHNSSAPQCSLVVEKRNAAGTLLTSRFAALSTPYLVAGNWSLLRLDTIAPAGASRLVFYMKNNATDGIVTYDDYRVAPSLASVQNTVYDPKTGRLSAELNNENLATIYLYDDRGRIKEIKSEIENTGQRTMKKYVYNEQKNF